MIAKALGAVLAVFAVLLEGVVYLSAGLLAVSLWAAWLWELKTEEVVEYDILLEMFEEQTGHKIDWWIEEDE